MGVGEEKSSKRCEWVYSMWAKLGRKGGVDGFFFFWSFFLLTVVALRVYELWISVSPWEGFHSLFRKNPYCLLFVSDGILIIGQGSILSTVVYLVFVTITSSIPQLYSLVCLRVLFRHLGCICRGLHTCLWNMEPRTMLNDTLFPH